jgi:hypothetical protein
LPEGQPTLKKHGGFVPKYLLEDHEGGFDGFLDCKKKIDGTIDCGCSGFTEKDLFNNARKEFLELMNKPINLQTHVGSSGVKSLSLK